LAQKQPLLNQKEFYDIYAISLFLQHLDKKNKKYVAAIVNDIAEKYVAIVKAGCRHELFHLDIGGNCQLAYDECGGDITHEDKEKFKKKHNLKRLNRRQVTLDMAAELFAMGWWSCEYGGRAWRNIARAASRLEKMLPVNSSNINKAISTIDMLNDIEHNTDLFMSAYCDFALWKALDDKESDDPEELIKKCSKDIKDIYKETVCYA
jgi:hypothetical protein